MSRPLEDWILDNVLNPHYGDFSISDALYTMKGKANVLGSSPNFITDWRWYKDITSADTGINILADETYIENLHNFIDYRFVYPARDKNMNLEIQAICDRILETYYGFRIIMTLPHFWL